MNSSIDSHLGLNDGHHVLHETIWNSILVLVHSAILGPLEMSLIDVTVRVANRRQHSFIREVVALNNWENDWSDSLVELLDGFKYHFGIMNT